MGQGRKAQPSGALVVDKPVGPSSMDVVRVVRRAGGGVKTGHAGTLDPRASGVLVCCLGRATKAIERVMGQVKVYEATVDLSAFTDTDDAEGERQPVAVSNAPDEAAVAEACRRFVGWIEQTPPAHSAVRVGGARAYELARQGEAVTLASRSVRVDAVTVLSYAWPELNLRVTTGKGVYVRSLARDLGAALGTGGHLTALRRTAVGPYQVNQAWSLDDLPRPLTEADLLTPPATT